jgi:hypothetical protein
MYRIISVKPLSNYLLDLQFSDGVQRIVDIGPFIGEGISAELKDETYFRKVMLEDGGGVSWPNGYDFCPNFLREEVPAVAPVVV